MNILLKKKKKKKTETVLYWLWAEIKDYFSINERV